MPASLTHGAWERGAAYLSCAVGDNSEDALEQGAAKQLRSWAEQGDSRHHEAHRQDTWPHQRDCVGRMS